MGNERRTQQVKICDMCGSIGFPEYIVTCCLCKKASEHIYCMQNQLYAVPEKWYCEECLVRAQIVHDGKVQETRKLVGDCSNFEKTNAPVERSVALDKRASPEQINVDGKRLNGSPNPLGSQDMSLKVLDVSKEERIPAAGSPSAKHVMQPSSHISSLKRVDTGKVKYIPDEDIVLRSRVKLPGKCASLGATSCRTDQANIKSRPILQKKYTSLSILTSSKEAKVLSHPDEGSVDADAIQIMTTEHVNNDKEGKFQRNKTPGEEAVSMLCKEKSVEGPVDELHLSSSKRTTPTEADCDFNAPPLHTNTEHRKKTTEKPTEEALIAPTGRKPTIGYVGGEEVSPSEYNRYTESKCVNSGFVHNIIKKENMGTGDFTERRDILRGDHASKVQTLKAHLPDKELMVLHNQIALDVSMAGGSGTVSCSDAQLEKPGFHEMDLQLTLLINPEEKHQNNPAPKTCWKGAFEVFDVVSHIYGGIRAHFPAQVSHKAYEILKKMPEKLKFNIVPRLNAWPDIFHLDPPTKDDIGLYFFPCEHERIKEKYIRLLERIDSHDFAMKSYVADVELLIFTSKQLQVDSQLIDAKTFLWGIFRRVNRMKPGQYTREQFSSCSPAAAVRSNNCGQLNISYEGNNGEVDMEVDMVGGIEICKPDTPFPRLDAPHGFAKLVSKDPKHIKKSLVKIPLKNVAGLILPDVPPGFSRTPSSKHGSSSPESNHKSSAVSRKESSDLVYSSIGGGYESSASKARELQSKHHQVADHQYKSAKHHISSPRTPSSENKKGIDSFHRPGSANERDFLRTETKPLSTSMDLPSTSAKRKWIYPEEIKEEKMEIHGTPDTMIEQSSIESPSHSSRRAAVNSHLLQRVKAESIEVLESLMSVSDKLDTREGNKGKEKMELKRDRELSLKKEQPSLSTSPFSARRQRP